jgi:thioredoxin reductase (NADPH)
MAGTPYVTPATLDDRAAAWVAAIGPWSRGRPLPSLDRAALLVLDLQRYFAEPSSHAFLPALEAILPRAEALVGAFRDAERPVVFTQHGSQPDAPEGAMQRWWRDDLRQGEARAQLVPALEALGPPDLLLSKSRYSAFEGTELAAWLQERDCDTVVICGVMTHLCCETTARAAFMQDLKTVVVADGCASLDEELHLGALRGLAHGFAVISTADSVSVALDATPQPRAVTPAPTLPSKVDLAIVGAGPAGLAAAIQARRSGVDLLLLDDGSLGGQVAAAERIENYPGFPGGISGARLVDRFVAQAQGWSLQPLPWHVDSVEVCKDGGLTLRLRGREAPLAARAVVVATGSAPRGLMIAGAEALAAPPPVVPTADRLPEVRGQRILVIGGGEAALDQALLARRRGAATVTVVLRGSEPRAMDLLVQRALNAGVELRPQTTLTRLEPQDGGGQVAILHQPGGEPDARLPVDAIVVCIGKTTRLPRLPGAALGTDSAPLSDALGRTPVKGLYLAGDARRGPFRQVAIAVGDGVAAAMHAVHYLRSGAWRS